MNRQIIFFLFVSLIPFSFVFSADHSLTNYGTEVTVSPNYSIQARKIELIVSESNNYFFIKANLSGQSNKVKLPNVFIPDEYSIRENNFAYNYTQSNYPIFVAITKNHYISQSNSVDFSAKITKNRNCSGVLCQFTCYDINNRYSPFLRGEKGIFETSTFSDVFFVSDSVSGLSSNTIYYCYASCSCSNHGNDWNLSDIVSIKTDTKKDPFYICSRNDNKCILAGEYLDTDQCLLDNSSKIANKIISGRCYSKQEYEDSLCQKECYIPPTIPPVIPELKTFYACEKNNGQCSLFGQFQDITLCNKYIADPNYFLRFNLKCYSDSTKDIELCQKECEIPKIKYATCDIKKNECGLFGEFKDYISCANEAEKNSNYLSKCYKYDTIEMSQCQKECKKETIIPPPPPPLPPEEPKKEKYYFCLEKDGNSDCRGTNSLYENEKDCITNLKKYFPKQTTEKCYKTEHECKAECLKPVAEFVACDMEVKDCIKQGQFQTKEECDKKTGGNCFSLDKIDECRQKECQEKISCLSLKIPCQLTGEKEIEYVGPIDIMLAVDNSLSLQFIEKGAEAGIKRFIDYLATNKKNDIRLGIVLFDDTTKVVSKLTPLQDRAKIKNSFNLAPRKGPYISAAIERARNELSSNGRKNAKKIIILFTGGQPWIESDPKAIIAQMELLKPNIEIYSIFFSHDTSKKDKCYVQCGFYRGLRPIEDCIELNSVFSQCMPAYIPAFSGSSSGFNIESASKKIFQKLNTIKNYCKEMSIIGQTNEKDSIFDYKNNKYSGKFSINIGNVRKEKLVELEISSNNIDNIISSLKLKYPDNKTINLDKKWIEKIKDGKCQYQGEDNEQAIQFNYCDKIKGKIIKTKDKFIDKDECKEAIKNDCYTDDELKRNDIDCEKLGYTRRYYWCNPGKGICELSPYFSEGKIGAMFDKEELGNCNKTCNVIPRHWSCCLPEHQKRVKIEDASIYEYIPEFYTTNHSSLAWRCSTIRGQYNTLRKFSNLTACKKATNGMCFESAFEYIDFFAKRVVDAKKNKQKTVVICEPGF